MKKERKKKNMFKLLIDFAYDKKFTGKYNVITRALFYFTAV